MKRFNKDIWLVCVVSFIIEIASIILLVQTRNTFVYIFMNIWLIPSMIFTWIFTTMKIYDIVIFTKYIDSAGGRKATIVQRGITSSNDAKNSQNYFYWFASTHFRDAIIISLLPVFNVMYMISMLVTQILSKPRVED